MPNFEQPKNEKIPESIKLPERDEKEAKLERIRKKVETWTDAEGLGIDKGIKETVVILNALDMPTVQSCEGHIKEGGRPYPWVRIEAPNEPEERFIGQNKAFEDVAKKYSMKLEEAKRSFNPDAYWEAMHSCKNNGETEAFKQWNKGNEKLIKRFKKLLKEFYQNKKVDKEVKIKVDRFADGRFEFFSGDEKSEEIKGKKDITAKEKELLAANLVKYREEMNSFTEFLKDKYLGQPQEKRDFNDEEVVSQILENSNSKDQKKLAAFKKWKPEQIELYGNFAKLRKKTLEKIDLELEKRREEKPIADNEELNMGIYKEQIEPQVRETVLNMRRKGYTTYESGFYWLNNQIVSFEKDHLKKFSLPQGIVENLESKDINIEIKPNSILLTLNKYLELDEIKKVWDEIERALPDLGRPALKCNIEATKSFREKQEKIKDHIKE